MSGPLLAVEHLVKTFSAEHGPVHAADDVSLAVAPGEFYALLGPSGCGKTTTLRCIAGLETPTSGEIRIDDEIVFSIRARRAVPAYQRDIGMVFQSYAIWPHMTVYDNVAYPLRYGSGPRPRAPEIRKRVGEALALVHLEHLAGRPSTRLSGGQQQRVALARALCRRPKLLLLDEPLSNLDAKLREEMRGELRDLLKRLGTTAVYVTHDQSEALTMSDRIAVMLDGRIVQEGPPEDVYLRPRHPFVATFVGGINLLTGRLKCRAEKDQLLVETPLGLLRCAGSIDLAAGAPVIVGIRPESITVSPPGDGDGDGAVTNQFVGTVRRVTFLGDAVLGEVAVGSEILRAKMRPRAAVGAGMAAAVGLPPEL